jgi:curved DNA-binding protein CbpA
MLVRPSLGRLSAYEPPIVSHLPFQTCLRPLLPSSKAPFLRYGNYFHTGRVLFEVSNSESLYDVLETSPSATSTHIKKQFYKLSKKYHPDLHPDDPEASTRFVKISTAWATLGSTAKRAQYDRDLSRSSPQSFGHGMRGGPMPAGSHSSAQAQDGAFGARPASGLSKRRGTFRGPPPSFYRSGGWGNHEAKRKAAAEGAQSSASSSNAQSTSSMGGGFSPGQGVPHADDYDVPHFDRTSHFRRQEAHDERLRIRRKILAQRAAFERESEESGIWSSFFLVSSAVALAWLFSYAYSNRKTTHRREDSK